MSEGFDILTAVTLIQIGVIALLLSGAKLPGKEFRSVDNSFNLGRTTEGPLPTILKSNVEQFVGENSNYTPTYYVETNMEGMRENDFWNHPYDERILVIGDSLTFGWGVNRSERFTDIVERKLNNNSEVRYQFVNAGQPGYGMVDYLTYLKHRGLNYDPDRVILAFSFQDVYSIEKDQQFREEIKEEIPANATNRKEKIRKRLIEKQSSYMRNLELDNSSFKRSLNEFDRIMRREEIPVTYFAIWELRDRKEWFKNWAESHNRTIIYTPRKMVYTPEKHIISKQDVHYNEKGHKILAKRLYNHLSKIY